MMIFMTCKALFFGYINFICYKDGTFLVISRRLIVTLVCTCVYVEPLLHENIFCFQIDYSPRNRMKDLWKLLSDKANINKIILHILLILYRQSKKVICNNTIKQFSSSDVMLYSIWMHSSYYEYRHYIIISFFKIDAARARTKTPQIVM